MSKKLLTVIINDTLTGYFTEKTILRIMGEKEFERSNDTEIKKAFKDALENRIYAPDTITAEGILVGKEKEHTDEVGYTEEEYYNHPAQTKLSEAAAKEHQKMFIDIFAHGYPRLKFLVDIPACPKAIGVSSNLKYMFNPSFKILYNDKDTNTFLFLYHWNDLDFKNITKELKVGIYTVYVVTYYDQYAIEQRLRDAILVKGKTFKQFYESELEL